jgi:voltage-gated potassium channel
MALLAAGYLVLGFMEDEGRQLPPFVLGAFAVIFLTEFAARCWDSESRLRYLRGHWLDLVSCIPLIGGFRSIRILRLLRLGAALRIFSVAEHEAESHQRNRESLWFVGPMLIFVWLAAASAYWSLEHGRNADLHNFGDALYWAFITATTVGYGDVRPVTPEGRIVAGFLIFIGIGLVGFASAQLTQRVLRSGAPDGRAVMRRMDDLERQLDRIEELLHRATGRGSGP